ncbi:MAG TPA: pitrilysin family protein [Polyangia bacterium]
MSRHLVRRLSAGETIRPNAPGKARASSLLSLTVLGVVACATTPPAQPGAPASAPATAPTEAAASPPPPPPVNEPPAPTLEFPNEAFRKEQPKGLAARPLKTPPLTRFSLPAGISVYLIERPNLPIVSMSLTFEGGGRTDPAGKEGRASVCASLISAGTEKLDRIAFDETLADIASEIGSGASDEQHWVSLDTLKKNLSPTLDLFAETVLRPGMRPDEFDRSIKRRIAGLTQMKGNPAAVASRLSASIVHGTNHAFGKFPTEATYGAISIDDCKKFLAEYVKPQGAKLFVVGAITKAEVIAEMTPRLKGWTGRPKAAPAITASKPRDGKIFFVDIPNAQQSVVQLMHLGPSRLAPDYQQTALMASILGGGFTSRINMNIREKHGYAYGARGGFEYTRKGGVFRAGASVKRDVTKESILEMCKEIRGIHAASGDTAPKDDELVREKNGRILALPAQFSTGSSTLGAYRDLIYFGLPLNYYDGLVAKVEAIQLDAVKKAAQKHLQPEKMQLLVVGDGKSVLPKLKELAGGKEIGGKLVQLDVDGKVIGDSSPDSKPAEKPTNTSQMTPAKPSPRKGG